MTAKKLIEYSQMVNIADTLSDEMLMKIAQQVIEDEQTDFESMTDWSDMVEHGMELASQTLEEKSQPWQGAANFKSPAVLEAAISFAQRAGTELLRNDDLVKTTVIGKDTVNKDKLKAGERAATYLNYQLNHKMGWRKKQKRLYYALPCPGSIFKMLYFDPIIGENNSQVIEYPNFSVNQAATCTEDRFTYKFAKSQNEVLERQRAGIWLEEDLYGQAPEADTGSNAEQKVEQAEDNPEVFFQQNTIYDIDEDGYAEPYIVTVHKASMKVVRIVARFKETDIFIKDGVKVRRLETGEITDAEVVRVEPYKCLVKYGFIPNPDGTFLDIGYYHLLSSLVKGDNALTNQLIDAGTLENLQGGYTSKNVRRGGGITTSKPGQWIKTDLSPAELQNAFLPHVHKPPSQTLYALKQSLEQAIQSLSLNIDIKGMIAPNAPATTTLGIIQEAMLPSSAIMQAIADSETEEFKILFTLNKRYADPEEYKTVLDDPEANYENDFNIDNANVSPTSNPEMSSRLQRIQLAEVLISKAELVTLAQGNVKPLWEFYFDAVGADELIDQIWPNEEDMTAEQQQALAAQLQAQQEAQRQQQQFLAIQIDHQERAIALKEREQALKEKQAAFDSDIKYQKMEAEIEKMMADAVLSLEKAESEDVKNNISKYTAQLQALKQSFEMEREAGRVEREEQAGEARPVPPTLPLES